MKHNLTKIVCALALLGAAVTANAQLSWNWVYGGDMSGSGTLTTTANLGGYYQITGITGTFGGDGKPIYNITGLQTGWVPEGANIPDNHLLADGIVSLQGLGFSLGGSQNVYLFQDMPETYPSHVRVSGDYFPNADTGNFSATLDTASVPEPSQIVSLLALSGLGGFGALVKFRRRK